jgi:hypothetical protein
MTDKRFFRVRLAEKSPLKSKIVNGLTVTKQWQVKVGDIGDFAVFPDVEAQVVVKQGNGFVPADEAAGGATKGSDGGSGQSSGSASTPAKDAEEAQTAGGKDAENSPPDFSSMTVEQLKNFLIAHGVAQNDLRNATKPDLIERAEFIWSQKK